MAAPAAGGQNFYRRDDRDLRFVLNEQLGVGRLLELGPYRDFTREDFEMILSQAQRIAAEVLAPTFQAGDREGCSFEGGRVRAPACFREVWRVFQEGGWFALAAKQDYGGQGLPLVIAEAAQEFFMSANFAFCCYSGMGAGIGALIEAYGTDAQRDLFLPRMYDGTWGASMCLTEPAVGSDAHLVAAKAVPDGDSYLIQGTKIFITSGEHDLTENIIHLVLARIEGDPPGAKGVSLFAVPKIRVNSDGSLGEANDVQCIGIEHKMGLKGSATCALNFGESGACRGYLIGQPGRGLAHMFDMVNLARMAVGLESVAFGANIYANVLAYAKDRVQGVPFGRKGDRVRIVEHADVRRMLMNLKALTEGMRALVYKAYFMEDLAKAAPTEEERLEARGRLELLTPLVKSYCSDRVFEMGREGIQILGGYGFTSEYPVEQYTRDCKILSIWDGTNYIQAVDLIGRKLNLQGGKVFRGWVDEVKAVIRSGQARGGFAAELSLLEEALEAIIEAAHQCDVFMKDGKVDLVPLTATRFLDCMAEVAIGHLLLEQGLIATQRLEQAGNDGADRLFLEGKVHTVRHYLNNMLPQVFGRVRAIRQLDESATRMPEECL